MAMYWCDFSGVIEKFVDFHIYLAHSTRSLAEWESESQYMVQEIWEWC